MWTFGCINCQHVIPSLKHWHADYKDQGFVLIGNHYPGVRLRARPGQPEAAPLRRPASNTPWRRTTTASTWNAYRNQYWPTLYLIDKRGRIRYVHIGEGAYDETERNIQALLAETYP